MKYNVIIRAILIGVIGGASAASMMGFEPVVGLLVGGISAGVVGYTMMREGRIA